MNLFEDAGVVDETVAPVANISWESVLQTVFEWCKTTGIKLIISILILFISFKIINFIGRRIVKRNEKKGKVDHTILKALVYAGKIALKIIIAIGVVGYLGIDTSGLAALVASLGVTIGLAVNGTLSNLAGGIMIIIARPFKDGDYIEALGQAGTVEDIRIIYTKIVTVDNKVVYLQNGALSTSTIVNYNEKGVRRVDFSFNISYNDDFKKAQARIYEIFAAHEKTLDEPAPFVRLGAAGNNAIEITARAWCKSEHYWDVRFDLTEEIKKMFDEEGLTVPYNQLDVHIKDGK